MEHKFFDCHTHTEFSSCAEDVTLDAYVEIAATTDQCFAVTDHSAQVFYPPEQRWGFWTEDAVELYEANIDEGEERIHEYVSTLRAAQCGRMLVGTELDVLPDGRKVFPDGLLETLDVIGGAVHYMPTLRASRPVDEVYREFRLQVEALAGHGMHFLVHPYRLLLADDVPVTDEILRWTVEMAHEVGFALEINSHKQSPECDLRMTRMALEAGVPIAIGTDTHRMEEFADFSYQIEILYAAGLEPSTWDKHIFGPEQCNQQEAAAG